MTNAGCLWSSGMRDHLGKTSKTPRSDAAHRSSQQVFGEMRASDPFAEELRGVGATRSARAARTERPSVSERRGGRHGQRGGVAGAIWGMTRDTQVDAAADTLPQAVSADAARPPTAMGSEEEDEIDFGEGTDIDLAGALVKIWSEESDDSERSPKRWLPPTSPCSCPQPVSTHRRALCPTQRRRRSWPPGSLRRPLQLSRKPMRAVLLVEGVALLRPPSSPPLPPPVAVSAQPWERCGVPPPVGGYVYAAGRSVMRLQRGKPAGRCTITCYLHRSCNLLLNLDRTPLDAERFRKLYALPL